MRTSFLYAAALLALVSCQSKEEGDTPSPSPSYGVSFTAGIDSVATKITAGKDADGRFSGKFSWDDDDEISVTDGAGNKALYRIKSTGGGYASFVYKSGDVLKSAPYTATYGGDFTEVQTYGGKSSMPMSASSTTTFLKFSVSGGVMEIAIRSQSDSISSIVVTGTAEGGVQTSCILECTSAVPVDETVYFPIALPEGNYSSICVSDSHGAKCTRTLESAVSVSKGRVSRASLSGPFSFEVTDLSAAGTANCYIVPSSGRYRFKAQVPSGTPASAEVLWESFGTEVRPQKAEIVSGAALSDGYVSFTSKGRNGNAVIAVKDAAGTVLWSWHIWACNGFDPMAKGQALLNGAGTMMDRNLGALSAEPGSEGSAGLMYQWGRKDPFPGGCRIGYESLFEQETACTTISWPEAAESGETTGTVEYAVAHPTVFITGTDPLVNWKYEQDNTLWLKSDYAKTVYDPCPYGWRVPDGLSTKTWAAAFGTTHAFPKGGWVDAAKGMDFGAGNGKDAGSRLGTDNVIWYPAAGYRDGLSGGLCQAGRIGRYASVATTHRHIYNLEFDSAGNIFPHTFSYRASALPVRCMKDPKVNN